MPLTNTWPASIPSVKRRLLGFVAGPDARAEAEGGIVGQVDGLVEVARAEQHRYRAEEFLAKDGRLAWDVGQHGGLVVDPGAIDFRRQSATRAPAAIARCTCSSSSSRICAVASGPTSVSGAIGSPTLQRVHAFDEALFESRHRWSRATMKRLAAMQDWPLLMHARLYRRRDGFFEIGAGHHDERIAAAQFEHRLLDLLRRICAAT